MPCSVAGGVDEVHIAAAVWQCPGALTLQLDLHFAATAYFLLFDFNKLSISAAIGEYPWPLSLYLYMSLSAPHTA